MNDIDICKNLLCEKTCDECVNGIDDFTILDTNEFPFKIPYQHHIMLAEKCINGYVVAATVYLRNGNILIKDEDYNIGAKYLLHFRYSKCSLTDTAVSQDMTCNNFKQIK